MDLNQTPKANRLHIAIFGKTNSGKSSLLNAITNQEIAIVSDQAGTTTDPVYKAMEIQPLGPCMLIDTAGFADESAISALRLGRTKDILAKTDLAILVCTDDQLEQEASWLQQLQEKQIPVVAVLNKTDLLPNVKELQQTIQKTLGLEVIPVSALRREGIDELLAALKALAPKNFELESIVGHLVQPEDVVLLVMPQDIQAPKGRLILPQVQTIRDLLDHHCVVLCVTTNQLPAALAALKQPPKLIITDSQVFPLVYQQKPAESLLTSFSVLFARYKGDIEAFVAGAQAIDQLKPTDTVLIAEACTHNPLDGDIGRIKLPKLLRKTVGQELQVEVVSGDQFPQDLSKYALVIHCGACMFNRKMVLSRVAAAKAQKVPITNYGVAIAKMTGILDKINLY